MAWIVVALSLIIIWVASLCKIFLAANHNSESAILDDGKTSQKKNVLFVIAHPDDESMFFSPTINYLTSNAYNLHMLCFSTGNADGKGSIREKELHQACAVLKVPLEQIKILDHPNFQDGFGKVWSHDLLTEIIEEEVSKEEEEEELSQSIFPVDSDETETDIAGNSNTKIITNPSFTTCLKNRTYELLIPANVVKTNGLKFGQWIKYIDGEGTLEGDKGKWADDRICFKGWDRICRRNRLKEQDTVVCELLHTQRLVHSIRIHIKRGGA